jgi:microtubule-associated protein-like 1/2
MDTYYPPAPPGLVRGARYVYGLDGSRKYRLEELEDGVSYVAASDRKFIVSLFSIFML